MLHKWQITKKKNKKGLPVWVCAECTRRVACEEPPIAECEPVPLPGNDPLAKFSTAELPCKHREEISMVSVSLCGTCSRDIEIGFCSLKNSEVTVMGHRVEEKNTEKCFGCTERVA
jgi:hypothetical protein